MRAAREITRDSRIKKVKGIYQARFSRRGIRVENSLMTGNYSIALDLVNKIEKAILNNEDYRTVFRSAEEQRGESKLISDLWPIMMEQKAQGTKRVAKLREKTLREYSGFWSRYYEEYWGPKLLNEITEDEWIKFIAWAREKSGREEMKVFNLWKYFSGFCSWCVLTKRLKEMPDIYNTDEEDGEDGIGKNYTDDELLSLRNGALEHSPAFHLWIISAQYEGRRSSEITQIPKSRINLDTQIISLKRSDTKTKQARKVPIHPKVLPFLVAQMEASGDSPYLFPNRADKMRPMDRGGFKKAWNELRENLGIDGRFHDFRHSYATRAFANSKINPVLVAKALGMSMKVAMDRYIHYSDAQLQSVTEGFRL